MPIYPMRNTLVNESFSFIHMLCGTYEVVLTPPESSWPWRYDSYFIYSVASAAKRKLCIETGWRNLLPVYLRRQFITAPETNYGGALEAIFRNFRTGHDIDGLLKSAFANCQEELANYKKTSSKYAAEYDRLQSSLEKTACLIFNSKYEAAFTERLGLSAPATAVAPMRISLASAEKNNAHVYAFQEKYHIQNYVLCVAPITPLNNQAFLAYAMKDTGLPVVFIGSHKDSKYVSLIKNLAQPKDLLLESLPPQLMESAYLGAKAFCLPTLTCGIQPELLRAAASGCRIIANINSAACEYLGHDAVIYDDFLSPAGFARKLQDLGTEPSQPLPNVYTGAPLEPYLQVFNANPHQFQADVKQLPDFGVIYIDVSGLWRTKAVTGIQRLEIEFCTNLCERFPKALKFVAFDLENEILKELDQDDFIEYVSGLREGKLGYTGRTLDAVLVPNSMLLSFSIMYFIKPQYYLYLNTITKYKNIYFAGLIPDMIIYRLKHLYEPTNQFIKHNYWPKTCPFVSLFITYSNHNRKDAFEDFSSFMQSIPPIAVFRLGDNILEEAESERPGCIPKGLHYILFISGFEQRKNHIHIYHVYRRLIDDFGPERLPNLVCVGVSMEPLLGVEYMIRDEKTRSKIHILHGIPDRQVNWLYENCLFTIYPSLYEGWGLPVAESLAHGKICIASNTSAIPEIAPGLVDLLDPQDIAAWRDRMAEYIFSDEKRMTREKEIGRYASVSWAEAAKNFISVLASQRLVGPRWPILSMNEKISYTGQSTLHNIRAEFLGPGWRYDPKAGVLCFGSHAALAFLTRSANNGCMLEINLSSSKLPKKLLVDITVNNALVISTYIANNNGTIALPLSMNRDGSFIKLRVDFHFNYELAEAENNGIYVSLLHFSLRPFLKGEVSSQKILKAINALIPGCEAIFRGLFRERNDLEQMGLRPSGTLRLLLWAWETGVGNDVRLARSRDELFKTLKNIHTTRSGDLESREYTNLVRAIWQLHGDASSVLPCDEKKRASICAWFRQIVSEKYGLRVSASGELENGRKGQPMVTEQMLARISNVPSSFQTSFLTFDDLRKRAGFILPVEFQGANVNLLHPGCQFACRKQFDEAVYYERCAELGESRRLEGRQWAEVYILQCLYHYGLIEKDGHGVGFEDLPGSLPSALATAGMRVDMAEIGMKRDKTSTEDWLRKMWNPWAVEWAHFNRSVTTRNIEPFRNSIYRRGKYDFAWSICASTYAKTPDEGMSLIYNSLDLVRPGGWVFHTVLVDIGGGDEAIPSSLGLVFSKKDIDTLSLNPAMELAPINWSLGDTDMDQTAAFPARKDFQFLRVCTAGTVAAWFGLAIRKKQ